MEYLFGLHFSVATKSKTNLFTAGRWGSVDSVDSRTLSKDDRSDIQQTNIIRSQVCILSNELKKKPLRIIYYLYYLT